MVSQAIHRRIKREKAEASNRIDLARAGSGFRRSRIKELPKQEAAALQTAEERRVAGDPKVWVCPDCGYPCKRRLPRCPSDRCGAEKRFIRQTTFEKRLAAERSSAQHQAPGPKGPDRRALMDNKSFTSTALACARSQVDHFNRKFGGPGSGVTFLPNGKPRFRSRHDKLRHMARRGMVDFDEVCGGKSR